MNTLSPCYDKLRTIIGETIEPYEVVETVEVYRQYFKPPKVNVILLAESHVYTTSDELAIQVKSPYLNLPSYPSNFVRFVYCLGYGENQLLQGAMKLRGDTDDFWKLFLSCQKQINIHCDLAFDSILKTRTADVQQRIANKCELLSGLFRMGVWLVDTSITGIYKPKGARPSARLYKQILHCSWDNHVKGVIEAESPKYVICIGKQVSQLFGKDINEIMKGNCVECSLPDPRIPLSVNTFRTCYKICSEYCH